MMFFPMSMAFVDRDYDGISPILIMPVAMACMLIGGGVSLEFTKLKLMFNYSM